MFGSKTFTLGEEQDVDYSPQPRYAEMAAWSDDSDESEEDSSPDTSEEAGPFTIFLAVLGAGLILYGITSKMTTFFSPVPA